MNISGIKLSERGLSKDGPFYYIIQLMEVRYMSNTQAWDYAIGLIKVDGLEPTEDFKKYIEKEKSGEATMEDLKRYLDKRYQMKEAANA